MLTPRVIPPELGMRVVFDPAEAGIDRKARELGMFARGGEGYPEFKDRIFQEIARRERDAKEATA